MQNQYFSTYFFTFCSFAFEHEYSFRSLKKPLFLFFWPCFSIFPVLSINLASLNRTLFVWYSEEYTRITETASSLVSRCFEKLSKNAKNTLKYIFSLITHRFQLTNRWCCQIRSVTILAGQLAAKKEEAKHTAHCPAMRSDATLKPEGLAKFQML